MTFTISTIVLFLTAFIISAITYIVVRLFALFL